MSSGIVGFQKKSALTTSLNFCLHVSSDWSNFATRGAELSLAEIDNKSTTDLYDNRREIVAKRAVFQLKAIYMGSLPNLLLTEAFLVKFEPIWVRN